MDTKSISGIFYLAAPLLAVSLYLLALTLYRLLLSPIANVPGPKLAALTQWYETYYEIFRSPGGQFMFHYRELHEKYGPIIRISPREVHIQDSEFFHSIYATKLAWDKPTYLQHRFGTSHGLTATPDHHTHRARRAALNPFFSKRAIRQFSPLLQTQMDRLCDRLTREYKGSGNVLRLDRMFACYSADAVIKYCFGESDYLHAKNFYCDIAEAMNVLLTSVHLVTQFPWVAAIINAFPKSLLAKVSTEVSITYLFEQEMSRQVAHVLASPHQDDKEQKHKTIFRALMESSLPTEELSPTRLQHEALTVVGAGLETVQYALSVAAFHIINTPSIYHRLRKALEQAIPNPNEMLPLEKLEQIIYLDAYVQESLRLSYGTSQRAQRISNHISIEYGPYIIPPGTTVSMDNYAVSHDERIFPDSYAFTPERWLDSPRAPDGKPLSAYMVSFARGPRQCIGMPLALAEMYIVLANLFRKFELELYETDRTAVDCFSDAFAPRPKPGTQGVRAYIRQ